MKNEDTIIMQPNNSENTNNVKAENEVKNGNGKRVAAVAAGAALGGATGSAGTATVFHAAENTPEEVTAQVDDTATLSEATVEEQQATAATTQATPQEEVVATVVDNTQEPDYTGNSGADPVSQDPVAQQASNEGGAAEVQVLGVYERTDENGVRQEAAVITDGQEVAAIVDVDGDGTADVLLADMNHNQQIDEGEVYDISEQNISMSPFEEQYLAQQQQQEMEEQQQQVETFGYTASDETADYNNGVEYVDV